MLRHPLAFFRPVADDDQPRTVTYYAPRAQPEDPRSFRTRATVPADVRQVVGYELPAGFDWAPRRPVLTVILGGDPTAQGLDEIVARAELIRAIDRWGVGAA